ERVVLTFRPLEEPRQSTLLAQRGHPGRASGQHLVGVPLMADVPDELVTRRVEYVVQRDGELHHAKPGADVSTRGRARFDKECADLASQGMELLGAEAFQVGRRADRVEEREGGHGQVVISRNSRQVLEVRRVNPASAEGGAGVFGEGRRAGTSLVEPERGRVRALAVRYVLDGR